MKYKPLVVKLVVFWLFFILACAPKHNFVIPHGNPVSVNPDIVFGHLENGFQYILMENTTPENRVNIHLNVFSGAMHENNEQQGVAHYLEHMLFNGSTHFPPGKLIKYFQSIGMDFGADANAHTSFFNTVYDISLPDNTQKQLDKAFLIMEDYAQGALLLDSEVDRERGVILSEKRQRDSISYRTFKKTLAFELPGSLLNKRFPIGIDTVLKKADSKLLKSYYDQWYRPDNMGLVVVGDFNARDVEPMVINRFSKLKPRSQNRKIPLQTKWEKHKGIKVFYHYEPEASSTEVAIETISWKPFKTKTLEDIKRETLNRMANAIIQNRLSRMVNMQTAVFSKASAYSGSFLKNVSLSAVNATCSPENWQRCLKQIERVLRQALMFGFEKNELERTKADFISSLERGVNQASTQKTKNLSRKILSTMNKKGLFLSEQQKKSLLKPYIESILLTDVHKAFKEIWSKDHRLVMVTGNTDIGSTTPETEILDVYNKSINKRLSQYKGFEKKKFPYLTFPPSRPFIKAREDHVKELDITKIEFENNTFLNIKKTDFKKNEFKFNVCFGEGDQSQPAGKPGLSIIGESVLRHSGLGGLDADQLEEALAGRDVQIGFGIKENYFSLSGVADPKEAELLFQLIVHYFKDPGFRQEALNLAKIRYRQRYESLMQSPDGIMKVKGDSFLAGNDVRFGMPHPDIIDKYTLNDIKNWLMPYFENASIEVSIVGDFNLENMIALASGYMGIFKKRVKPVNKINPKSEVKFPKGKRLELSIDSKVKSGVVRIAFLTDDFWDIGQTRRLSILSRIFSERLRILIREELGETYSPYAYNDPSMSFKDYGVMHSVVHVKPERVEFVYNKLKEIIHSLTLQTITKEETDSALKPVINHLEIVRKNNNYWLNSVMANSYIYPQKFEWAGNMPYDYGKINYIEMNGLARKYLSIDQSALIIIKSGK